MGLGTKIKEALGGDHGSRRRKTPGAYPEPSANIPRSDTATTFQTAQTNSNGPQAQEKPERVADDDEYDDYTTTPTGLAQTRHDPVSPMSGDGNVDDGFVSTAERKGPNSQNHNKEYRNLQHPYWGDVGKPASNDFAVAQDNRVKFSDKDSGIGKNSDEYVNTYDAKDEPDMDANYAHYGNGISRNGTISSNGHSMPRDADGLAREQHFNQADVPTGNVSRGRAMLVDDDTAMISSMAASQHSHGSQLTETPGGYQSSGRMHGGNTGYAHPGYNQGYAAESVGFEHSGTPQRKITLNGRENGNNTYATTAPPVKNHAERAFSPEQQVPIQGLSKTSTGLTDSSYPHPAGAPYGHNTPPGAYKTRDMSGSPAYNGRGFSDQAFGESDYPRQASGSTGNNSGASNSPVNKAGGDHYGPGHGGARVLHCCVHCGNDNDITKYFSKDVVYRLS